MREGAIGKIFFAEGRRIMVFEFDLQVLRDSPERRYAFRATVRLRDVDEVSVSDECVFQFEEFEKRRFEALEGEGFVLFFLFLPLAREFFFLRFQFRGILTKFFLLEADRFLLLEDREDQSCESEPGEQCVQRSERIAELGETVE